MSMGEADFREIVELIDDGVVVVRRGRTLYRSLRWGRRLGELTPEEARQSYLDFIAPEDRERVAALYREKLKEYDAPGGADPSRSRPLQFETTLQTAAGERIDVDVKTHLVNLEDGPATVLVLRDITARRATERALRESEERYRLLSELTSDFTFALRHDASDGLTTEWVAGAYRRITGYEVGEIYDRGGWATLIHPEDRERARVAMRATLAGDVVVDEFRFVTKDNEVRWIRTYTRPALDEQGNIVGVIGAGQDQTGRREAERALERSNTRLREVNRQLEELHRAKDAVTATVSHELRTPLVTGLGYVEMALSGAVGPVPAELGRRLRKALDSLLRLRRLIDGLLQYNSFLVADFFGPQTPAPLDIAELARQTAAELLVGKGFDEGRLKLQLPDGPVHVLAQPEPMRIALSNLLNNAAAHAGDGAQVVLSVVAVDAARVRVTVSDDGVGIPEELRERVWDLFTRSRGASAGLGLGLAIVHAVLRSHQTEPHLESAPGQGTRIWFELPADP